MSSATKKSLKSTVKQIIRHVPAACNCATYTEAQQKTHTLNQQVFMYGMHVSSCVRAIRRRRGRKLQGTTVPRKVSDKKN
jgi:hypothetical protein